MSSIGYNFGSLYKEGYQLIPSSGFQLNNALKEQAKLIFMFDMLIGNADRGAGKPNLLTNGDQILVFDHELAFSFASLLPFARTRTPWIFGPIEEEMYKTHHFYGLLKGELNDFAPLVHQLDCFNSEFWQKALNWIPDDWKSEELQVIQDHVTEIGAHKSKFADQLTLILAS